MLKESDLAKYKKMQTRFRRAAGFFGLLALLVASCTLLGWIIHNENLKSIFPQVVAMNPATSVGILICSFCFFAVSNRKYRSLRSIAFGFALIPAAVGLIKLASILVDYNFSIDTVLFGDQLEKTIYGGLPNRMAPNTALCLVLIGAGIFSYSVETRRDYVPSHWFALAVAAISFLSLLGYGFRVKEFYGILSRIPMALTTALSFFSISLAMLFSKPDKGIMKQLTGIYAGSILARILVPAAILIPTSLGYFRLLVVWRGWYSSEMGTTLLTLSTIVIFLGLITYVASVLNKRDQMQIKSEAMLAELNEALEQKVEERTAEVIRNEQRYRVLIENNNDLISLTDENSATVYQSPSAERIHGWSLKDRDGIPGFTLIHPDDEKMLQEIYADILQHPSKLYKLTVRVKHKQGHYVWLEGTLINLLNDESVKGVVANFRDVTDRKIAEEKIKQLNENLEKKVIERTAQLEAVNKELESFSYSVSHDLRAPLRAITGYAQIMESEYTNKLDDEARRLLKTISFNAEKMGKLIDDLLAFSRLGRKELQKQPADMVELVDAVCAEISKMHPHKAKIKVGDLHKANIDYGLMNQVFVNLVSNAIKYSSKKSEPVVEIGSEDRGKEIVYYVKDNGAGFDMKYADKLFGVFQRLHSNEEFEGTGVGLAIVQRVITKHGGRIWADAVVNEGATFYFALPK